MTPKSSILIERFTQLTALQRLHNCPICGSAAELWEFQEFKNGPALKFVGCSHSANLGHQQGDIHEGCLLNRPSDDFYQPTVKAAIEYWEHYCRDLIALRRTNTFKLVVN